MSDSRRWRNYLQRQEDREQRAVRDTIRQALRELGQADAGAEVNAIYIEEEDLLRYAESTVRFADAGLDPQWLRGFSVVVPTDAEDQETISRAVLRQALDQAIDFDGDLSPTSFDPAWIRGPVSQNLRDLALHIPFVVRKDARGGWMVRFRKRVY